MSDASGMGGSPGGARTGRHANSPSPPPRFPHTIGDPTDRPGLLTLGMLGTCIALFLWIRLTNGAGPPTTWVAPGEFEIRLGAFHGLVTTAFVHFEPIHLFFNMYWLWHLGGAMERSVGSARYLGFVLLSAAVSSSLQLSLHGSGIGFSGVIYALFGFGWMAREAMPPLRRVVHDQTVRMMLGWMVLCIIATELKLTNIGNVAHASGLLFGVSVGALFVRRWRPVLSGAGLGLLAAAAVVTLFWAPWSAEWHAGLASQALSRHDDATAERHLRQSFGRSVNPAWVWLELASLYHRRDDDARYNQALEELRKVDPGMAASLQGENSP